MNVRTVLALLITCVTLSTGIGFAAAKLSGPEPAKAAGGKAVAQAIDKIDRKIGYWAGGDKTVLEQLRHICHEVDPAIFADC